MNDGYWEFFVYDGNATDLKTSLYQHILEYSKGSGQRILNRIISSDLQSIAFQ